MKKKTDVAAFVIVLLTVLFIVAVLSFVVMILWNCVMPRIIVCDKLSFLQAIGLTSLVSVLTMDKSKLFDWLYE